MSDQPFTDDPTTTHVPGALPVKKLSYTEEPAVAVEGNRQETTSTKVVIEEGSLDDVSAALRAHMGQDAEVTIKFKEPKES